jgi:CHAT domain-containing protein
MVRLASPADRALAVIVSVLTQVCRPRAGGNREAYRGQGRGPWNVSTAGALLTLTLAVSLAKDCLAQSEASSSVVIARATAFDQSGQADSALHYYRRALEQVRSRGNGARTEAALLARMARMYHRAIRPADIATALAYYDSAATARWLVRAEFRVPSDSSSSAIQESEVQFFEEWALAYLASPSVSDTNRHLGALAIIERGRSHQLLDLRGNRPSVLNLARIQGEEAAADGKSMLFWALGLESKIAGTLTFLVTTDTLLAWLALEDGEVLFGRQAIARSELETRVSEFRRALGADPGFASPPAGQPGAMPRLEPPAEDRGVKRTARGDTNWLATAGELARTLLPEELMRRLPESGQLIVVPDKSIALVPFAALPLPTGEPLGTRYGLRYAPSLTALRDVATGDRMPTVPMYGDSVWRLPPAERDAVMRRRRNAWLRRGIVVGNPSMPGVADAAGQRLKLPPLPGAESEARWVGQRLGVTSLQGPAATETRIRQRLAGATVIHMATHGYAYSARDRVRESFIALAPDAKADGHLTVGEVFDSIPNLSADLIVLSACQTGLGSIQEGEGTIGLQYAFLAKGARTLLVSLWSVSDVATDLLMRSFYTEWLGGSTKTEALRNAQKIVRGKPGSRFHHPRYWAAFQLVGAN